MIQLSTQSPTGMIPGVRAAGFPLGTTSDFALALADLAGAAVVVAAPAGPPGLTVAVDVPTVATRPILASGGKDLPVASDTVVADPSIAAMPEPGVGANPVDPSPLASLNPTIVADTAVQSPIPATIARASRLAVTDPAAESMVRPAITRASRVAVDAPEAVAVGVPIDPALALPTVALLDAAATPPRDSIDGTASPVLSADPVIAGPTSTPVAVSVATPEAPTAPARPASTRRAPVATPIMPGVPAAVVAPPVIGGAGQATADGEQTAPRPEAEDVILSPGSPTIADPIVTPGLPLPAPVALADTPPAAVPEYVAPAVARSMPIPSRAEQAASPPLADAIAGTPSVAPTTAAPASAPRPPSILPASTPAQTATPAATADAAPIASPAPVIVAPAPTAPATKPKSAAPPIAANPTFTQPGAIVTPQTVSGIRVPFAGSAIAVGAKPSTTPGTPTGVASPARGATVPADPAVRPRATSPAPALPVAPAARRAPAVVVQAVADIPADSSPIASEPAVPQVQPAPGTASAAQPRFIPTVVMPTTAPVVPVATGIVPTDTARTIDLPAAVTVTVVALPAMPAAQPQAQPAAQAFAAAMFAAAKPFEARADESADDLSFGLVAAAAPAGLAAPTIAVAAPGQGQSPALDLTKGDWMTSMIDRIETLRDESGGVRETRMKLAPEALGTIEVSVRRDEQGVMQVRIAADTPQARAMLADAAPKLAEMAEARGVKLGGSSVDSNAGFADSGKRDAPAPAAQRRAPSAAANDTADITTDSRLA